MLDTGCCGTDLKQDVISKWGVFSLVIPLFYLTLIPGLILKALGLKKNFFWKLFSSSWKLTQQVQVFPKLKCELSAKLHSLSPFLAGISFKTFALVYFSLLWVIIIFLVRLGLGVF